jgi:hypothetical protein
MTAVAVAAFAATWWTYARLADVPAGAPFAHLRAALVQRAVGTGADAPGEIALTLLRLVLWASPFLLALWILALTARVRALRVSRSVRREDVLHGFALIVLVGYLLAGRTTFSFPRYHVVMLPVIAVLAARVAADERLGVPRLRWLAAAAAAALAFWLAGDPLASTYSTVRERLAAGGGVGEMAGGVAAQAAVIVLAPWLLAPLTATAARPALARALAACAIAWGLAIGALQVAAPYHVRYAYGGRGTAEVVAWLARLPADAVVLAPAELLAPAGNRASPFPAAAVWTSEPALAAALAVPRLRAVVYGLPTNTLAQVRFLDTTPRLRELLERRFERRTIGSYTIWSAHS